MSDVKPSLSDLVNKLKKARAEFNQEMDRLDKQQAVVFEEVLARLDEKKISSIKQSLNE